MKAPLKNSSTEHLLDLLSPYLVESQKELEAIFKSDSEYELASACQYIIGAGGKRLRPVLALLACEAVKGDFKKALPVSAAIELAHTLSIIQDDIFDQATTRRGVKPVHVAWGTPIAILVSDYLFLKMVESILKVAQPDVESQKLTVKILHVVVEAGLESVEGEYLDLQLAQKEDMTVEECLLVAKKKTGSLIQAALEAGALIGEGSNEEIYALKSYGEKLGIAYQIVDDLLGVIGSKRLMGKDVGSAVKNKRANIVVAHALHNGTALDKQSILEILRSENTTKQENSVLTDALKKEGSIQFAQELAEKYAEEAASELNLLESTKAKVILGKLSKAVAY